MWVLPSIDSNRFSRTGVVANAHTLNTFTKYFGSTFISIRLNVEYDGVDEAGGNSNNSSNCSRSNLAKSASGLYPMSPHKLPIRLIAKIRPVAK